MSIEVRVEGEDWPFSEEELSTLTERVFEEVRSQIGLPPDEAGEIGIIFGDNALSRQLNCAHRGIDKPTNVLSFPQAPLLGAAPIYLIGDVVLARETIVKESESEGKALLDHLAHLIVHGILHLYGYDHESSADAEIMESLESDVLRSLLLADPHG